MNNEKLRADIKRELNRPTSMKKLAELLNRCYVALGESPVDQLSAPSEPAAQGWVPVSEGLPESATDVLVYGINHGSRSYTVAGIFNDEWASQETEEPTRFESTHWMPLPKCPEIT